MKTNVNKKNVINQAARTVVETLEGRQMLSVSLTNGALEVETFNNGADYVDLYPTNNGKTLTLTINGVKTNYAATDVKSLVVLVYNGNNKVINGTNVPATIFGGDNNDTIFGGSGKDYIYPYRGSDVVSGGLGEDTVSYAGRTDGMRIALDGSNFSGNPAKGEKTTLYFDIEEAIGTTGNDTIIGSAGPNYINASDGNDLIDGMAGDDTVWAGDGNDTLSGGASDTFNTLHGQGGDDTFAQGSYAQGRDIMWGETGMDTVDYSARPIGVNVSLDGKTNDGADVFGQYPGEHDDVESDIEIVRTGNGNDKLIGNAGKNIFYAGAGDDLLIGLDNDDQLFGMAGNDTVSGGNGNDLIGETGPAAANSGTDYYDGGLGLDTIDYGARTDKLFISQDGLPNDGAIGEYDNVFNMETVIAGQNNDKIVGNANAETLIGGKGNDTIYAGDGNDVLFGNKGDDQLFGEAGDDTLNGGYGADLFFGGAGLNWADYADRTENLVLSLDAQANDGDPTNGGEKDFLASDIQNIKAGKGNDKITGDANANVIDGYLGNDTIYGGANNDTLTGGDGKDQLFGEAGDDTLYSKDNALDTLNGGTGTDKAKKDAADIVSLVEVNL